MEFIKINHYYINAIQFLKADKKKLSKVYKYMFDEEMKGLYYLYVRLY